MTKTLDWNKISSKEKKTINKTKPIFIIGSREISEKKIDNLVTKLTQGTNKQILWGCLKEKYIEGLENSPQFSTLKLDTLKTELSKHIKKRAAAPLTLPKERISILNYYQRDLKYIFKELDFSLVIFINGSWHRMLHTREEFWTLLKKQTQYKLLSPFTDEREAKTYAEKISKKFISKKIFETKKGYTEKEIMEIVKKAASRSFDHTWQTGCALVAPNEYTPPPGGVIESKNGKNQMGGKGESPPSSKDQLPENHDDNFNLSELKHKILLTAHNKILPYETYAMHHGSAREKNFSPPNDLNNYDTIHAEVDLILQAQQKKINLQGKSLYIELMPCPTCAKMIAESEISEVVYHLDHSNGYAFDLLKSMDNKVKRI